MNQQRIEWTPSMIWGALGLAAIGLILVAAVWDLLAFTLLRRWFRILPIFAWGTWGLMLVLLLSLIPLVPRYPETHLPSYWPAVFVTVPAALALLRWETKRYIWSLASKLAQLENYIRTNGGELNGNPQRGGPVA